jgi:hypothetical protein
LEESTEQLQKIIIIINIYHLLIYNKLLTSAEHRNRNKPFYIYKGLFNDRRQIQRPPHDQCTCMRAMPFIYRGHQGPVPKGHLDRKWLNKMKLMSSSWPMYMEEICIIQIQRPSRAGAVWPIFIIIFLNASNRYFWTDISLHFQPSKLYHRNLYHSL